jgi:hypothetical protein
VDLFCLHSEWLPLLTLSFNSKKHTVVLMHCRRMDAMASAGLTCSTRFSHISCMQASMVAS